ncbi:MAG: oligosaccharide flippase family protein [Lachnoclostridium sp.]|nr:oligosaccharide flippase family protein [Lachnoclostridium sp.]
MAGIRSLFKDTAIYGLSSIIGRFLNWCLVPLYTIMFPAAEYGVVTYIYSFVALVLIILTYGMETGFFRFANHERYKDPDEVYSTGLISLGITSTLFIIVIMSCLTPVSSALKCEAHPEYIAMMAITVALDAFTALPFCYLRFRKRPIRFASLRLVNIGLNIGLNLFFILICPWLWENAPGWIAWFYDPEFGIGYIFLSNLIASVVNLPLLFPELHGFKWKWNSLLWREMIVYSFPLLVLGIAGIMNQTLDKILFPYLYPDEATAMTQLGIYGANYKIAIVMVMFIQAFRFAYEPFIFAQARERGEDKLKSYADAMKYFVIFAMVIFLGVMYYLDIIRYFISPRYFEGLKVVPIVMLGEFFFGVFFNLSLWYKLTDKTIWGTWFSLMGVAVTIALNCLLVPVMGYMGCAWAAFACYAFMMISSYFVGQKKYPINYEVKSLAFYFLAAMALWGVAEAITWEGHEWVNMAVRTPLLLLFIAVAVKREKISLHR